MKNFSSAFLTASVLFFLSCSGTPDSNTQQPFQIPPVNETPEIYAYDDFPLFAEDSNFNEYIDDEPLEITQADINDEESIDIAQVDVDNAELTEITQTETDGDELAEDDEQVETAQLETIDELIETLQLEPDDVPVEMTQIETDDEELTEIYPVDVAVDTYDEEIEETETPVEMVYVYEIEEEPEIIQTIEDLQEEQFVEEQPVEIVQTAPVIQEPPPQAPPETVQSVEQPPVQYQPPTVQIPPVPPPALLGPAEEIRPLERGNEEPVQDFARNETPIISQDLQQSNNDEGEIIFSRVVRATVGQTIEIPFRGTGWVYLGELASRRGIAYDSRRLDSEGQSFIFRAEEAGTYALRFYRQDFIRNYILNDHVQVIVGESQDAGGVGWFNPPVDRGRVIAEPRWPSALEEAELQRGGATSSLGAMPADSSAAQPPSTQGAQQVPPVTSSVQPPPAGQQMQEPVDLPYSTEGIASLFTPPEQPQTSLQPDDILQSDAVVQTDYTESVNPDVLIQRAKESFDAGNIPAAIALLDQVNAYYPSGTDELYWLYGQFYEANTPSRNILLSLDYYNRLVNEFPQSSRYNDARSRINYIERFYLYIR